jgi:hypothetical protein
MCFRPKREANSRSVADRGEEARTLAVGGHLLTLRLTHILIFLQMARDIATALYRTGIDPFTKKSVTVATGMRDRKMQRALMQFFKPENWFTVREALIEAGRQDLIGNGCDCLIPAQPSKEVIEKRRREAQRASTTTARRRIRRRGSRPASAACPTKHTGQGGRAFGVRTESRSGKAAVVDRPINRLGLAP